MRKPNCNGLTTVVLLKGCFLSLFLLASSFFVKSIMKEYLEGTKYFSTIQKPLSKDDLPTITICILSSRKLVYNADFELYTVDNYHYRRSKNGTTKMLDVGKNEYIFLENQNTYLRQLYTLDAASFKSCVSLDLRFEWSGKGNVFGIYSVNIKENVRKQDKIYHVYLYLTSYQNSYGAAYKRWYDGKVQQIHLQKGGFDSIDITKVARYEHIKGTCKHTSFYQCVGLKLNVSEKCQENGIHCTSFSTPTKKRYLDYPICQSNKVWKDCERYRDKVIKDKTCRDLKPCIVQEYEAWRNPNWSVYKKDELSTAISSKTIFNGHVVDVLKGQYMVHLGFYPALSVQGKYTTEIQVDVYKEYWTLTGISLVGNIGGQLGLFLGFSFAGFMAWLLDLAPKLLNFIKNKVSEIPDSVN